MSAIVTGVKTTNGVISMGPGGKQSMKTVLEYAEERGLSTGVISNMNITDVTPAACYAHAASRKSTAEIFAHFFDPRVGNGPDVVIGAGRKKILEAIASDWPTVTGRFERAGYTVVESLGNAPAKRFVALFDEGDFDPIAAIDAAIAVLSKNPKGYFLMLEWDMHTDKPKLGLDRVIAMDDTIRRTAGKVGRDTLLLFTADHSFDLRLRSGKRGDDILPIETATPDPKAKPRLRIDGSHTGEQVLVAAQGPGARNASADSCATRTCFT
jgi:alkaline phosphatase